MGWLRMEHGWPQYQFIGVMPLHVSKLESPFLWGRDSQISGAMEDSKTTIGIAMNANRNHDAMTAILIRGI
jgi:hypothetical protein